MKSPHIIVKEDLDSTKINLPTEESLPFAYLDLFWKIKQDYIFTQTANDELNTGVFVTIHKQRQVHGYLYVVAPNNLW